MVQSAAVEVDQSHCSYRIVTSYHKDNYLNMISKKLFTVALSLFGAELASAFSTSRPSPIFPSEQFSSISLSMAKGGRGGLDVGGTGGPKPKPLGGNSNNSDDSSPIPKKGKWSPVSGLPSLKALPQEEGVVKLVDTLVPALINKQTNPTGAVSIVNYMGTTYCFSSSCSSCKIPVTQARVLPPNEETGNKDPRLQCDFCGATYNLRTGEPVKKEGGKLLGFLFSKSENVPLPVYALGEQGGKVFINVP
mmetsp:Transcript_9512/g.19719  ORF Transcript_9512/g.19719 Transcript_9512/m.19719 type:complete len:249 (+) Transcript_9512:15-761(+)